MQITKRQDKIKTTLNRHMARLEKLENGDMDKRYQKQFAFDDTLYGKVVEIVGRWGSIDYTHDVSKLYQPRWSFERDVDIIHLKEQIRQTMKKLAEAERLDAKETEKIEANEKRVSNHKRILSELPDVLRQFMEDSKELIYKTSIEHRNTLLARIKKWETEREGMPWRERYDHRREHEGQMDGYQRRLLAMTEEQIKTDVERDVEYSIIELMNRVTEKVGKVTDASNLHYKNGVINGFIVGEKGKVRVETILAGGYNIQCLHIRTLLK